jgi:zinc and cadmium transporter
MNFILLFWILLAVIGVSLISLIGVVFISLDESKLQKYVMVLVSFASGALLGGAFLHLLPESVDVPNVFVWVIAGILLFFIAERFLRWRHCHKGICDIHTFTYLNLAGDGVHNFIDGMVIAAAFLVNVPLGITVTLAVAAHEIPQEIGDFGILVYGGMKRKRALLYNLLSASTAIIGATLMFFIPVLKDNVVFLLPFAAGGFIYIACVDLMPELHKQEKAAVTVSHITALVCGLVLMWMLKILLGG